MLLRDCRLGNSISILADFLNMNLGYVSHLEPPKHPTPVFSSPTDQQVGLAHSLFPTSFSIRKK